MFIKKHKKGKISSNIIWLRPLCDQMESSDRDNWWSCI